MERALWIATKNQLCHFIKQVSDHYGGDDVAWLREYAKEVVETYKDDLGTAIDCFGDLCSSFKRSLIVDKPRPVKTNVCGVCGRVPPFCYGSIDGACANK
jgi:hypothetical protein